MLQMEALYKRQQGTVPGGGGACSGGCVPERVARWGTAWGLGQREALLASWPVREGAEDGNKAFGGRCVSQLP